MDGCNFFDGAGRYRRQVYLLHSDKIPPLILEGAVDGGSARSGAILLGESVKEGLSAGLVKQVVVAVLDEQRELSLQHDFKVICFALLE